jgi:hypothetical protein
MDMFPFHDLTDYQFKHLDEPLILPDDILGIIRALSKPVFQHWHEFKEIKRILNHYCFEERLAAVEKKLYTPEADHVFASLVAFKDAYVDYLYRLDLTLIQAERTILLRRNEDYRAATDVYLEKSQKLQVVLYGEEDLYGED